MNGWRVEPGVEGGAWHVLSCYSINSYLCPPPVNKEHPFRDEAHLFYRFMEIEVESVAPAHRWSSYSMLGGRHSLSHSSLSHLHPLSLHHTHMEGDDCSTEDLTGESRTRSTSSFSSSPRGSLSSLLEECFDTIAALGPETLIYATLKKE